MHSVILCIPVVVWIAKKTLELVVGNYLKYLLVENLMVFLNLSISKVTICKEKIVNNVSHNS